MSRSILQITNEEHNELYLQIDPFADIYFLKKGEKITFGAYPEDDLDVLFEIEATTNEKTIWLPNNSKYFVLVEDEELEPAEYYAKLGK